MDTIAEKLLSPTKVVVAAFPHERTMLEAGGNCKLKLSLVGTLVFGDGHTLDSRKVIEIDVSDYLLAYERECRETVKRSAPGGDPV